MISWIVFDLDGTLYDTDTYFRPAFHHLGEVLRRRIGAEPARAEALLWEHLRRKGSLYRRLFDDVLEELAPQISHRELVLELVGEFHRAPCPTLDLYDDARRFCSDFRHRVGFAMLTNGSCIKQVRKIEALNLQPVMSAIVYCQDLGAPKPASHAYRHLLRRLDCRGEECLYVGDNPSLDFPGAKDVGMMTVHLRRGEFRDGSSPVGLVDHAVDSFDELNTWLAGRITVPDNVQTV